MTDIIRKFADAFDMFPHSGLLLAAVSGGSDSMCLLHVLKSLRPEYGYELGVVHYNHRLRGAESDRDEQFVRSYCQDSGILFIAGSGDISAFAASNGMGIEESARTLRYDFFEQSARKTGAVRIVTAHNADDNAETLLMNISRGSGSRGFSGIPPVRGKYVRPLLCLTKSDIHAYINKNSIPYVEDSSNAGDDYTRNWLRHQVLPKLKCVNPRFSENALRACMQIREDDNYLDQLAENFIDKHKTDSSLPAESLMRLPVPVKKRVIRQMCPRALSSSNVEAVLALCGSASPSSSVDIPGMTVFREYDRLVFGSKELPSSFSPVSIEPGKICVIGELGYKITCNYTENTDFVHKSLTEFLFKTDAVCGTISIRSRRTGDTLRLSAKSPEKTLKKLFIEKRIPLRKRGLVPVIADDNGVLAVYGLGSDIRAKARPGDSAIHIKFEESAKNEQRY